MTIAQKIDLTEKLDVFEQLVELSNGDVGHEELKEFISKAIASSDDGIWQLGAVAHFGKKALDLLMEAGL